MHKILILTASFGNGHNAAACNVRDGLEAVSEDVQVEVLDLFKICYGRTNDLVNKLFLRVVQHAPKLWEGMYSILDKTSLLENRIGHFKKLRLALLDILKTTEPDVVISTYPAYNYIIDEIYCDHRQRPFSQVTVVTDSITVNSVWYGASSDFYLVANQPTAQVLVKAGVPAEKVLDFGFPVAPRFEGLAQNRKSASSLAAGDLRRIFYIIHHGKRKAGRILEELLEIPRTHLTILCSADPDLKGRMIERTRPFADRVTVLGWTNQVPEILAASHLVISKAGGALVQEALAGRCPILVNQVLPGQEEGNAKLVEMLGTGAVVTDDAEVLRLARSAFEPDSQLMRSWERALQKHSRPGAALRIAEFLLQESHFSQSTPQAVPSRPPAQDRGPSSLFFSIGESKRPLLCDFHAHTNYSDGKLTVAELVDFYGHRDFDCLCITDHIAEQKRLIGKISNLSHLTLPWDQVTEYFEVIEAEKRRAWKKFGMVLMTGLEFNKDGLTQRASAHLLGIDLTGPISPDLGMKKLIRAIHQQGGLAVASHPHETKSLWGRDTLYLWQHQDQFAHLLDAWEIANRDDLFNPVGLKRLPFLANSDFHKPCHIYSWKTLLNCEKHPEAIKRCVRENQDISITLYRDASAIQRGQPRPPAEYERTFASVFRRGEQLQLPILQGKWDAVPMP